MSNPLDDSEPPIWYLLECNYHFDFAFSRNDKFLSGALTFFFFIFFFCSLFALIKSFCTINIIDGVPIDSDSVQFSNTTSDEKQLSLLLERTAKYLR